MIILRKYPEEQKEFSILSEISRLGLKKGTKNYIRKRKRDIVNKLIQNKREFLAKTKKTERKLTNLRKETKENELIADNLKKEANKVNADIIPNNKFSKLIYQPKGDKSYILNKEKKNLLEEMSNDKSLDKASRELAKSSSTKDAIINLNADAIGKDTPFAAHEVGHIKGEKDSIKNRIANSDSIRGSFNKADKRDGDTYFESDSNNSKFPKLKSWKRKLIDKRLILSNEKDASDRALAKKYNLPREMQKAGNKSLDYSFRTYESNAANKMMTDDTVRLLGKYKNK